MATIVSYYSISRALSSSESVAPTQEIVDRTAETPEEEVSVLDGLTTGLLKLRKAEGTGQAGVLVSTEDKYASLFQSFLAEQATQEKKVIEVPTGGLEAKFDEKDWLRWFGSFFSWWKLRGKTPHKWQTAPSVPESFPGTDPNKARMAILGDWGTGLYGAPHCANSIAKEDAYLRQKGATPFGLLMHLGDVYYSGTADEVKSEFLKLWPDLKGSISRACNSNHEMYTGGNAYFDLTLTRFGQKASYFALQNDFWIVVGLDSAYNDPDWLYNKADLTDDQVDWLQAILKTAEGRKLILLSHHQPFSYLSDQNPRLVSRLSSVLTEKRVFAWYWGHEHRCLLYDRHPVWGFYGRCAGHSGYPYFRDSLSAYPITTAPTKDVTWRKMTSELSTFPTANILDGPNPYIKGEEGKYGTQGYLTLEFDDQHLNETVRTPDGTVISDLSLA